MSLFKRSEKDIYQVVKQWINLSNKTDNLLDEKYKIGTIADSSVVNVSFAEPSSSITDTEILANIEKKLDMGLMSRSEAIQELRDVDSEQAIVLIEEIDSEDMLEDDNAEIQGNIQEPESQT